MNEPSKLELELHAYVDGNLDDEGMARVEEYLRNNPEVAVRVWSYLEQKDDIRRFAIREAAGEEAPSSDRLVRTLAKRLQSRKAGNRGKRVLAAALLLVAGWLGHGFWNTHMGEPHFIAEVVQAHLLSISDPGEIPPLSSERLSRMFARVGEWEHLPNLSEQGFEPVGAELLPSSEGIVLHIPYRRTDGAMISYFLLHLNEEAEVQPHRLTREGVNLVYWQHDHARYALASPLPDQQLASLVDSIESARSQK